MARNFSGWIPVKIDSKGRLRLPWEIHTAMAVNGRWYVSQPVNRPEVCIDSIPNGEPVEPDADGRILLPFQIRQVLVGKALVIAWLGDHVEIAEQPDFDLSVGLDHQRT